MTSNQTSGPSLAELSSLPQSEFKACLENIFEHSPWVAERAWKARPFASVGALHEAMVAQVRAASHAEQLALIKAHPELAGKEALDGTLTRASSHEQQSAGLDQCSADEIVRLRSLNLAYRESFGFPFVIAVKGLSRKQIMEEMDARLQHDPATEFSACLREISKIARFRLDALLEHSTRQDAPDRLSLPVEPLSAEAFTSFGEVVEISDAATHFTINDGNTERYHDLARIDPGTDGRAIVSIFRGLPRKLPFEVKAMERHPRGSQTFVPLSNHPYLVVVAPRGRAPTANDLRAFLCQGNQGVNYAAGVWHHPLLALEGVSDFLVIDRKGPGENCDIIMLAQTACLPSIHPAGKPHANSQ